MLAANAERDFNVNDSQVSGKGSQMRGMNATLWGSNCSSNGSGNGSNFSTVICLLILIDDD